MKDINIGIANFIISNKLKDAYFSDSLITETKTFVDKFFDTIKKSPILQLEFKVYDSIENKHIDNDLIASRYIDNNIKLFEVYTLNEINNEHNKLKSFITDDSIQDNDKIKLYNSINNLIYESLNDYNNIDVDEIHESFTYILNHIKKPKNQNKQINTNLINEDVIEIAVEKFNEKYQSLNEDDKNLIKILIKSDDNDKEALFESYKIDTLLLLEKHNKEVIKDSILKAIQKINTMKPNVNTINDDIIGLHELKKNL